MKRKFEQKLINWKENNITTPLLVIGSRQVGKTYIIDKFCKENFEKYIYINFEKTIGVNDIFNSDLNPEIIIFSLSLLLNEKIDEDTVIFFDEIQVCEKALTSLKYFNESDKAYKIICAGSLLGVKLKRFSSSFPVGKVQFSYMFPMDFEEFLLAIERKDLVDLIQEHFMNNKKILESIHSLILEKYKMYLITGGYPKAILTYLNHESLDESIKEVIEGIYISNIADMRQYVCSASEVIKIESIYNKIPAILSQENKKFKYSVIKEKGTKKQYELPLDWLEASKLVYKCYKIKQPLLPLKGYTDYESFKIYLNDVGVLSYLLNIKYYDILIKEDSTYKGAITENYVASTLITSGIELHYYRDKNNNEVDFLIQTDNNGIIPIEVKSNTSVKSRSLTNYINKEKPKYAIRISSKNFGYVNKIKSIPLYAVHLINEKTL